MAMLSYLSVLCVVPLVLNKEDEYVYFHARQGLVLWIWGVISIFAMHIPVIGPFFFSFSATVIAALSLIGMVSVVLGRAWRLPIIYILSSRL
ncbi:MAG: hypothetical protein HQL54_05410 [Magnetococcales bacterium]|nr:hypothetical protein [Magnetococcales bacterium]